MNSRVWKTCSTASPGSAADGQNGGGSSTTETVSARAGTADETDWNAIAGWYDVLVRLGDNPVVQVNRAVNLAVGANNLFDVYPDPIGVIQANTGLGKYGLFAPFGLTGGFYYARVGVTF